MPYFVRQNVTLQYLLATVVLLFLTPSLLMVQSKVVSSSFKLSGVKTEQTLTKFALSPRADGFISISLYAADMYPSHTRDAILKLYLYSEGSWRDAVKDPTCEGKINYADKAEVFSFGLNKNPDRTVPGRKWRAVVKTHVGDFTHERPQYWYVTVADCSLERYFHDNDMPTLSADTKIMENRDDVLYSHLSYDEVGMVRLHLVNAVLSFLLAVGVLVHVMEKAKRNELHISTLLVMLGCGIHGLSSLLAASHLTVYDQNGIGSYSLDCLSAHLEALVDSVIAWILLAVSVGWTLPSDVSIRQQDPTVNRAGNVVNAMQSIRHGMGTNNITSLLIALSLVVSHAFLCQWGRTYDGEFDCYHDLEHLPGRVLLLFRFFMALVFTVCVAALRRHCHSHALHSFLVKFAAVGASWFVCLPCTAMVVSSNLFDIAVHRRHPIMTSLSLGLQLTSLGSLVWLFTGKDGSTAYHKVRTMNNMGGDGMSGLGSGRGGGGSTAPASKSMFRVGKMKVRCD